MASILLVGPGAIGATLATWLAQDDRHELVVAARTPVDSLEVTTPQGVIRATPRVVTDPARAPLVDWMLVTTKAYDSDSAAAWFAKAAGPRTRLAVIQNGVEHVARFEKCFDRVRIVPVMIDLPADRVAPGRTVQRGPAKMVVPAGENGAAFIALFSHTNFDLGQTDDFPSAVWKKLCLNCAGAVNAVLLEGAGISHHDGVADLMRTLVRECMTVGRAEGASIADSMPDDIVAGARRAPRDAANSMLADRRAGRPMEIEARNGVIVRLGGKHGILAPMNALMVALLEAVQKTPEKRAHPLFPDAGLR
jgi:2-dehydropantoate 2-reductase